jgi:hypothetical protein
VAKFEVCRFDDVGATASYEPSCQVAGLSWSQRLSPDDYSLWLLEAAFEDGGVLRWDQSHGDQAVYVFEGGLSVDGRICPAGGAVIVESGAVAEVGAVGPTRVAHFGTRDAAPPTDGPFGAPEAAGHGVHVVGPGGRWTSGRLEDVRATWFADSTCPTCRAALFLVEADQGHDGPAHTHTEDEIIYLLDGGLRMGARAIGPRTSLCIPGKLRYAFRDAGVGHRFLNFRADASYQTRVGGEPLLETPMARGGEHVGDLL